MAELTVVPLLIIDDFGMRKLDRIAAGFERQRGKRLLRRHGEMLERWNEHLYDRGGMRRVHLRGREKILKRVVVHAGAANPGLLMRTIFGAGMPKRLQGSVAVAFSALIALKSGIRALWRSVTVRSASIIGTMMVAAPHSELSTSA